MVGPERLPWEGEHFQNLLTLPLHAQKQFYFCKIATKGCFRAITQGNNVRYQHDTPRMCPSYGKLEVGAERNVAVQGGPLRLEHSLRGQQKLVNKEVDIKYGPQQMAKGHML